MSKASVRALRARHGDDTAHSDHVCRLATRLFIGTLGAHRVSPGLLPVLQAGALLHNVGLSENPANHHLLGRDIVVGEGLRRHSDEQTRMIACLVAFHRKRVHPEAEPLWRELSPASKETALRLAGILRVADGLDYSMDQATRIVRIRGRRPRVVLRGSERTARMNAARGEKKSDLWAHAIGPPPEFRIRNAGAERFDPPLTPRQTLRESAHVVLQGYLAETIGALCGILSLSGVEPRHDVRVGLRRFRSALRVHRALWKPEAYEEMVAELRWFGELLGAVRDRDVSMAWLDSAVAECPDAVREDVARIRTEVSRERRAALKELIRAYQGPRFAALLRRAERLTEDEREGAAAAQRALGDEALRVFRKRAKTIRAFEPTINEWNAAAIHSLRIECRRMRYAVDAWYGALGQGRKQLQRDLRAAQDALGAVHDADVRREMWSDHAHLPAHAWLHTHSGDERAVAWKRFRRRWPGLLKRLEKRRLKKLVATR